MKCSGPHCGPQRPRMSRDGLEPYWTIITYNYIIYNNLLDVFGLAWKLK
jgi:hypothetical protein